MTEDRSRTGYLDLLTEKECGLLLRSHDLGRIGLVDMDVHPLIFPVNYFFDNGVVVFRTARGSKLQLAPGTRVCFEVDGWDEKTRIGWSVLVKGVAHDITHAPEHHQPVHPMAPGERDHWIGISAEEITGRRFRAWVTTDPTAG